jgi:rSAM/selenodomain-associated transferase 1
MATVPAGEDLRQVQVAILAKAPLPGLAKTRLIPALGAAGAARLQRLFTVQTVKTCVAARLGEVTLWCTPDDGHRLFRAVRKRYGVHLRTQAPGDLGRRMDAAFHAHCAQGPLLLVGTDCPALTPGHLRDAARALLAGRHAVFQPAEDGGYVLIGLRRPMPFIFEHMPWSTAEVLRASLARAHAAGLDVEILETLWDVDLPQDLARLRTLWPQAPAAHRDRKSINPRPLHAPSR